MFTRLFPPVLILLHNPINFTNARNSINGVNPITLIPWLDRREVKSVELKTKSFGQVAQSVEQGPEKPRVGGSIPSLPTISLYFFIVVIFYLF